MAIAKVLLVDDDEIVRFGLAELLEDKGFDITAAASVPEALKHISSETYDVLLSDLHMPGGRRWPHGSKRDAPRQPPSRHIVVECIPGDGRRGSCHPAAGRSDPGEADGSNGTGRRDQAEAGKWTSRSSRGGKCGYDS